MFRLRNQNTIFKYALLSGGMFLYSHELPNVDESGLKLINNDISLEYKWPICNIVPHELVKILCITHSQEDKEDDHESAEISNLTHIYCSSMGVTIGAIVTPILLTMMKTALRVATMTRPSSPVRQDGERRTTFFAEYAFRRFPFSRFDSFYFLL